MEQIWWERVPNAWAFTSDVVENLLNEKSVLLTCSGEFSWRYCMVSTIMDAVKQQNSSKRFENIMDVADPGIYLLNNYCKSEKRAEYRPSKTYAEFFAESDDIVLHSRYFWVRLRTKEQVENWTRFVSEYVKERNENKDVAVFILEWTGDENISAKKGIKTCSLEEYISEYDRIVFCTLAASSVKEKSFIKNYLTELVANVVGNDIELCAECLLDYKNFLIAPYDTVNKIIDSVKRSDLSDFMFSKTVAEVEHLIWLSQIRMVYPLLEEFREGFVKRYSTIIAKQLPITSSYGETVNNPEDVELGTLKFMADDGRLKLSQKEYDHLKINKEARNKLSHLTPLTFDEIENLDT